MWVLDFEYDGRYLSDFNFVVCRIGSTSGMETVSAGSNITFNTVPLYSGRRHSLCSTSYSERLQATLTICKNPCLFDDVTISDRECREIMRWLNRREFLVFRPVVLDESDACFFNASFNVNKIIDGDRLCGLELSLITDAPFGYGKERTVKITNDTANTLHKVHDYSDEIGFTYPVIKVVCKESGTLKLDISNGNTISSTVVKNCMQDEVITFESDPMIVSSSNDKHKIYDDFNYDFPKLSNTIYSRVNIVTASIKCDIEIKYRPIIKGAL